MSLRAGGGGWGETIGLYWRDRRSQELEARGEKWVPGLNRFSPVQSYSSSSEAKDGRPRTLRMLRRHMDDYADNVNTGSSQLGLRKYGQRRSTGRGGWTDGNRRARDQGCERSIFLNRTKDNPGFTVHPGSTELSCRQFGQPDPSGPGHRTARGETPKILHLGKHTSHASKGGWGGYRCALGAETQFQALQNAQQTQPKVQTRSWTPARGSGKPLRPGHRGHHSVKEKRRGMG